MGISFTRPKDITFFESKDNFQKGIQFKTYSLRGKQAEILEHSHDYMQIWYVCSGECIHWINNREQKMVKGDLFVIPPFVVHKVKADDFNNVNIIGLEFSASFINDKFEDFAFNKGFFDFAYIEPFLVSEDKIRPKLMLSVSAQRLVETLMCEMLEEYNQNDEFCGLFIKANLLKLLAIIAREYLKSPKDENTNLTLRKYSGAILDSIQYIKENYNEDIRLEDICKHSMMSKTYFCYLFKSLIGKTFTEYYTELRIMKALEMLTTTDKSVTQICFDVGYNDVTHFCRIFKRVVGVPPKIYRKVEAEHIT